MGSVKPYNPFFHKYITKSLVKKNKKKLIVEEEENLPIEKSSILFSPHPQFFPRSVTQPYSNIKSTGQKSGVDLVKEKTRNTKELSEVNQLQ